MILRPFFPYYGSCWSMAPLYPRPRHDRVIEPFAGSACYSLHHPERDVVLVERDPVIAELWRWLLRVTPAEVLALPDLEPEQSTDDLEVRPAAKTLILARHWPAAARYNDVRTVGGHCCWQHVLEPVDLICGGFPCQDLSYAGKGAGLAGARSGLWSEFARIVRQLRPRYVVVENVPALLARGLGVVLGDLASCGYDATWDCIPAAAVGADHERDRLFLVAHAAGANGSRLPWGTASQFAIARGGGEDARGPSPERWDPEPDVGRVADGIPARVDRLRALGNAVVPQVAEVVGRVVLQIEAEVNGLAATGGR